MDYNNGGLSTEMGTVYILVWIIIMVVCLQRWSVYRDGNGLYTSMDYNNGGLSTEMGTVYVLVWIIIMVVCLQRWERFMY